MKWVILGWAASWIQAHTLNVPDASAMVPDGCPCQPGNLVAPTSSFPIRLPKDIESSLFSYVNSIQDLSICQRVCKEWSLTVSQKTFNLTQFSSRQDFLQQLVEESVDVKTESSMGFLLQQPPFDQSCSVSLRFWLEAMAKYGDVQAYKTWFESSPLSAIDKIHAVSSVLPSLLHHLPQHQLLPWLEWWINEIHQVQDGWNVSQVKKEALYTILECGVDMPQIQHTFPSLLDIPLHGQDAIKLIEAAASSSNRLVLTSMMEGLLDNPDWPFEDTRFVQSLLAACATCIREDLDVLLERYTAEDREIAIKNAFTLACSQGHLTMVTLLYSEYPWIEIKRLHLKKAVMGGHLDLVHWIHSHADSRLVVNVDLLQEIVNDLSPISLVVVNQYIETLVTTESLAKQWLQVYAKYACGNHHDLSAFKLLVSRVDEFDSNLTLEWALSRRDWQDTTPSFYSFQVCKKNESTQVVEYVLKELKVLPTRHHLYLALDRGRLDFVKLILEAAEKQDLKFHFNDLYLYYLVGFLGRQFADENSYQESSLFDFILDRVVATKSLENEAAKLEYKKKLLSGVLNHIQRMQHPILRPFDCYRQHIIKLLNMTRHI